MQPIKNYIIHPTDFFNSLLVHYGQWLPESLYIKLQYRFYMGYWIDFNNPKTFNEKLQWLKLKNRRKDYSIMVDKYSVKNYVAKIIGNEHIIPMLGVWDRAEEVEWERLPNQFVLKTTNGGGGSGVVLCRDKSNFDYQKAIIKLNNSLNSDIYRKYREWPYKNVKKRIIAEVYLSNESDELRDYKFFCFNGKVRLFKVDYNRFIKHNANYYDRDGVLLPFGESSCLPDPKQEIILPSTINDMINLAEKVADGNPFMRVDFYDCCGKIYFGEITFYPAGGLGRFEPEEWDNILGEWLELPKL